jgi:hypothetical protein
MTPELYHPVLDCFIRGLPFLYRGVNAPAGTAIRIEVTGECGGQWVVHREPAGWSLITAFAGEFAASVTIPEALAWRIFTKGIDRHPARAQVSIEGYRAVGEKVLDLTAIVA